MGVGVWMRVGYPCPPVCNNIVTPRHLFLLLYTERCHHHHPGSDPGIWPALGGTPHFAIEYRRQHTAYHAIDDAIIKSTGSQDLASDQRLSAAFLIHLGCFPFSFPHVNNIGRSGDTPTSNWSILKPHPTRRQQQLPSLLHPKTFDQDRRQKLLSNGEYPSESNEILKASRTNIEATPCKISLETAKAFARYSRPKLPF